MSRTKININMEAPLIHDSETQARQAGVRGSGTPRQLLYRAGKLFVDLQVQTELDSSALVIAGQIIGGDEERQEFGGLQVALEYEDGTTVDARSSDTGEFLLSCPDGNGRTLAVEIEDWLSLELELPEDVLSRSEESS